MNSIPAEVVIDSQEVEVHVAGPGYGESILIVIGGRIVIGIDCCAALVQGELKAKS